MQLFRTKGQKFLRCPGTKGQRDKLKILAMGRDGTGRNFLQPVPSCPGTQSLSICTLNALFFPMISCFRNKLKKQRKLQFQIILKGILEEIVSKKWNSVKNNLKCPKPKSLSHYINELFIIYQNNKSTIRQWDDQTIVPSSDYIILKIVRF